MMHLAGCFCWDCVAVVVFVAAAVDKIGALVDVYGQLFRG